MKIIYASTSGNVEVVVEKISEILKDQNISSTLHRAEQADISDIKTGRIFLFATSTWEHGEINPFFNKILSEMQILNMSGKSAGFVGLGDTRYEQVYFNQGIKILREAFLAGGGREIGTPLLINGEPYHVLDTIVKDWAFEFIEALK